MPTKIIRDKEFLHKQSSPVLSIQEGEDIAKKLLNVLRNDFPRELGLSANQLGILKRVSVICLPEQSPLILINPIIVESSKDTVLYNEGCLSVPGKIALTTRNLSVQISTLNHANILEFGPDTFPVTSESVKNDLGLLRSVCIQHEINHLDGKLITDPGVRTFFPQLKSDLKYGRNDKVMIEKDGQTKYLKYKLAVKLIETDNWKLI